MRFRSVVIFACSLLLAATSATADESHSQFSRVVADDQNQPQSLQLAIVSYGYQGRRRATRVDLIAAAHVADQSFYSELNERFEDYDALLYELVAPAGTVIKPGMQPSGFLSGAQRMMAAWLGLSLQLEEINYTPANFVHADLTPGEFAESMAERDESLYSYAWAIFFAAMRDYRRDPLGIRGWQHMMNGAASPRSHPLKVMMAYEFADLDRMQNMLGSDSNSTIIGARNQRAVDVLERELSSGKKRIGIFYGAAHMRDLEQRLLAIGLVPVETTWVDAWAL